MSADNRTVSTDALATLGTIIGPDEKRDAIHLAVIPVVATHRLMPGTHVNARGLPAPAYGADAVGIVDPFLDRSVGVGEYFWLVIYPRKITSLRHVWDHPAFAPEAGPALPRPTPDLMTAACVYIDHVAKAGGYDDREEFLKELEGAIDSGCSYVDAKYGFEPDTGLFDSSEFWHHWSVYTGKPVPDSRDRPQWFNCAC